MSVTGDSLIFFVDGRVFVIPNFEEFIPKIEQNIYDYRSKQGIIVSNVEFVKLIDTSVTSLNKSFTRKFTLKEVVEVYIDPNDYQIRGFADSSIYQLKTLNKIIELDRVVILNDQNFASSFISCGQLNHIIPKEICEKLDIIKKNIGI